MRQLDCNVLVVGCGAAGLTSALAALEEGASVIVLERAPEAERGGNTRWTEALLRMNDHGEVSEDFISAFTAQAGHHISPEFVQESIKDYDSWSSLLKALPFTDPELLSMFVAGVPATLAWLQPHGISTHPSLYPLVPALPAPLPGIYGGGLAIIETLAPLIERMGAKILYETTAAKLLQDEDNRVIGVKATDENFESVIINAQAVILACGGFEGNPEMVAQYIGPHGRYMRPVARGGWYNKGEGIRMALAANAAPAGDYAECHRQPIDPRASVSEAIVQAYPLGIVVNALGDRFIDEAPLTLEGYLEEPLDRISKQPGGIGYFIFDAQIDATPNWRNMVRSDQQPFEADSIDALAGIIGIPADRLSATVEAYNAACPEGPVDTSRIDLQGTRGLTPPKSNWARPLNAPRYFCYPIIASNTFTFGGLKVNATGQVVSTSGVAMPGLYAAGETVGIHYGTYIGATSVLRALVFGKTAGTHAARMVLDRR